MSSCRGISLGNLGSVLSQQGAWAEATPCRVLSHISQYYDFRTTPGSCFLLTVGASPISSFSHLAFTATSLGLEGGVCGCHAFVVPPAPSHATCRLPSLFHCLCPIVTRSVIQTCRANRTLVLQVRRPRHSMVKQELLLPSTTTVLLLYLGYQVWRQVPSSAELSHQPECLDFKVQSLKSLSQAHGERIWLSEQAWAI